MNEQGYPRGAIDMWVLLESFPDKYSQFSINQLRWLLRHRTTNGLDKAVRKIGKRLYIHEVLFNEWITNNVCH